MSTQIPYYYSVPCSNVIKSILRCGHSSTSTLQFYCCLSELQHHSTSFLSVNLQLHDEAPGDHGCVLGGAACGVGDGGHLGGRRLQHLPDGAVHGSQQERPCGALQTVLRQHRQHGQGSGRSQVPVLSPQPPPGQVQRCGAKHRARHPAEVPHCSAQGVRLPRYTITTTSIQQ